jgi:LytS/YehU family sensor histidine kinase
VRALAMGKREFSFVSAAADNMKRWQVHTTTTATTITRFANALQMYVLYVICKPCVSIAVLVSRLVLQ